MLVYICTRVVAGLMSHDLAFARCRIAAQRYVILHPYSMKEYKYWAAEKWAALSDMICEQTNCTALFTRIPDPMGDAYLEQIRSFSSKRVEDIGGVCSFSQLAAIISESAAFVGVDTG